MLKRCGALWIKEKGEKKYMSGVLDLGVLGTAKICVFTNDRKEGDEPDCTVHLVLPDPENQK